MSPTKSPEPEHIVVVGNGMVGYKFCEKLINKETALMRVNPEQIDELLHPMLRALSSIPGSLWWNWIANPKL